ncbi:50S ribosomal protein L6 [Patescibacteria group bacterium]
MSRIGKQTIVIPEKTEVVQNDGVITVKGPLGELKKELRDNIEIKIEGNEVTLAPKDESKSTTALWGTYASHIKNMVDGVNKLYEKKLIVEGVGFKVDLKGNEIEMALGFSHPVKVAIPEGITVAVEKNTISISSIDKEALGQFAAKVRALKKPEPYKGKGIRYEDEVVRRKQGKKAV